MKKSRFAACGLAAIGLALSVQTGRAADKKVFAMVPKAVGVPFYAGVEEGCKEEAAKIGAECLFTGPNQVDEAEQVRIIRDLITKGVTGMALAPNNPSSVASVIVAAEKKGIPVITFDTDAPKSKRVAFVGTNNEQGGKDGGEAFAAALPKGGTYAIITGGLAADNLNERIKGFKSQLGPNFKEISGSPFPTDDNSNRGIQVIQDILTRNPNLSGMFFSGGWPMFAPEAYTRAVQSKAGDIKKGTFVIVSFDVEKPQLKLLKEGLATALVGQRPHAMGVDSVDVLNKLSNHEKVPSVIDTGVDLVTSQNVDKFMTK